MRTSYAQIMSPVLKNFFLIVLSIAIVVLAYRGVDLGVTLTYSNDEIDRLQRELHVVSKYQGYECSVVIDNADMKESVFEKDGKVVIDGVEFECEKFLDNMDRLVSSSSQCNKN